MTRKLTSQNVHERSIPVRSVSRQLSAPPSVPGSWDRAGPAAADRGWSTLYSAADHLGVSSWTTRDWVLQGLIPSRSFQR